MNWTTIQTMLGQPVYDLLEETWCLVAGYEDDIYGKCVKLVYLRGCITIPFREGRFEMTKPVIPDPPQPDPEEPTDPPTDGEDEDTGDEDNIGDNETE